ncbi:xylulokinase [Terrimonas pollutisoli]|uniref:xylulokinase n=1 Tax=Terrimonas pollutisoli TaxID=3034147 RepID=UPI0023EA8148|nr:FGGY family carbohydrate kinase [Terrimonas sp. H1YJ31]
MLLMGIDLGTSSIKISILDAQSQQCITSATYPETEADIISLQPGWAEQDPNGWWEYVQQAILKCNATGKYNPKDIAAIGIAYQMHGLVLVDQQQQVLRHSIIWCDSRAVEIGEKAFHAIGEERCLSCLLNSPGNFTASKLAWVKENEPALYEKIDKVMLPGDFIAMKMTGSVTTTSSALSEGVFWDFGQDKISDDIINQFGFHSDLFPAIHSLFSSHGELKEDIASALSLKKGIPVAYKAGDQLNNALSLNVLNPGEVATTAGTSGVIYGVSDELSYDQQSRINSFAHLNHDSHKRRIGILLCINGTGIFNRWIKNMVGPNQSYQSLNEAAAKVSVGSAGLLSLPFGNGAERMLNNKIIGAHFHNLDFNIHGAAHMVRAVQEGIAFSFRYGLDIMRENGINPTVVRAGRANLFLSDVFARSFTNVNDVSLEFYEGDGSFGAAVGAGIGAGIYQSAETALQNRKPIGVVSPESSGQYEELYQQWKERLNDQLRKINQPNSLSLSLS